MKKITSLLMLFVLFFGMALAQNPESLPTTTMSKAYTLTAKKGLCVKDGRLQSLSQANVPASDADAAQQFSFVRFEGKFYLYSIGSKKFVNNDCTLGDLPQHAINGIAVAGGKIKFNMGNDKYLNVNGANNLVINSYSNTDGGNSFAVKPVTTIAPVLSAVKNSSLDNGKFGNNMHWYTMSIHGNAVKYDAVSGESRSNSAFANQKEAARLYAFVGDATTGYQIYNYVAKENKVLWKATAADEENAILMVDKTADAKSWSIEESNFGAGFVVKYGGEGTWYLNERGSHLAFWDNRSVNDEGSQIVFHEVKGDELKQYITAKVEVTIEHICNGVVLQTNKIIRLENENLDDLSTLTAKTDRLGFAFERAEGPATASQGAKVIYHYTIDSSLLPFVVTTSTDQPVWYTVDMHSNADAYLWMNHAGNVEIKVPAQKWNDIDAALNPDYQWCVMGNPLEGFQFFNRTKGFEESLNSTDTRVAYGVKDTEAALWYAYASKPGCGVKNGVCFKAKDNTPNQFMNHNAAGYIGYYGVADEGSTCRFIPVGQPLLNLAAGMYAEPAAVVGTKQYFCDFAKKTSFDEAYENLNSNKNSETAISNLKQMYDAASATDDIVFDATKLYRIQNALNDGFLDVNGTQMVPSTDANSLNTIWQLSAVNGASTVKHMNSGKFASNITMGHADGTLADVDGGFSVEPIEGSKTHFGIHKAGMYLCHNRNANAIMGWNDAHIDNDHSWYLIPVETIEVALASINQKSYATLYLPFAVSMPSDVKAYMGVKEYDAQHSADILRMKEIKGNQLSKNTGVVLKSDQNQSKVKFTVLQEDLPSVDPQNSNFISGSNVPVNIETVKNEYYVLGNGSLGLGFYHFNGNQLGANKAFVHVGTEHLSSGLILSFDDEVTGVEEIASATEVKAPVYDLSGRRVQNVAKRGLYIQNGKKFIVK